MKEREGTINELSSYLYNLPLKAHQCKELLEKLESIIKTPCPDCVEKGNRIKTHYSVIEDCMEGLHIHKKEYAKLEAELTKAQERVKELTDEIKDLKAKISS